MGGGINIFLGGRGEEGIRGVCINIIFLGWKVQVGVPGCIVYIYISGLEGAGWGAGVYTVNIFLGWKVQDGVQGVYCIYIFL